MVSLDYSIIHSEEYKEYIYALYRCSSCWIDELRIQYAQKAYEMYKNETIRKIVLEYGKEIKKADEYNLRRFTWAAEDPDTSTSSDVRGDCLNKAGSLADTIYFLFDIQHSKK